MATRESFGGDVPNISIGDFVKSRTERPLSMLKENRAIFGGVSFATLCILASLIRTTTDTSSSGIDDDMRRDDKIGVVREYGTNLFQHPWHIVSSFFTSNDKKIVGDKIDGITSSGSTTPATANAGSTVPGVIDGRPTVSNRSAVVTPGSTEAATTLPIPGGSLAAEGTATQYSAAQGQGVWAAVRNTCNLPASDPSNSHRVGEIIAQAGLPTDYVFKIGETATFLCGLGA